MTDRRSGPRTFVIAVAAFALGAGLARWWDHRSASVASEASTGDASTAAASASPAQVARTPEIRGGTATAEAAGGPRNADAAATTRLAASAAPRGSTRTAPSADASAAAPAPSDASSAASSAPMVRLPIHDGAGFLDGTMAMYRGAVPDLNQEEVTDHFVRGDHLTTNYGPRLMVSRLSDSIMVNGMDEDLGGSVAAEIKRRGHPKYPLAAGVEIEIGIFVIDDLPGALFMIDHGKDGTWSLSIMRDRPRGPG
jgi:hypothetical protein